MSILAHPFMQHAFLAGTLIAHNLAGRRLRGAA